MTAATVEILSAGPLTTVQDLGRPGHLAEGLSRGGAADRRALAEAAALLRLPVEGAGPAAIETPGAALALRFGMPVRVALTGAPMRARIGGRTLVWDAAHDVAPGDVLDLRPGGVGVYSYVLPGGGVGGPALLGSRAAHLGVGLGAALRAGDVLDMRPGGDDGPPLRLVAPEDRFAGGTLRLVPGPQTDLFPAPDRDRFAATAFRRDPRGNRQGVRLALPDGAAGFATAGQLSLMSDFILPGDVQMTGDGVPYVLGPECQTMGGYPRIGTVIAADLPRALQAPPGAPLRFRFVTAAEARAARPGPPAVAPLRRDPRDIPDLLGYRLIDGAVDAREG